MKTIEEMKKEVQALVEANKAKLQEKIERNKLEALIKLESNETLLEAKAKLQLAAENTDKLQSLIEQCKFVIQDMPIINNKTRENRIWQGNHRYIYGQQVDSIYELCTGIMYSCPEHKELMLAATGLSMSEINSLIESFGNPAYFSNVQTKYIESVPASLDNMLVALGVIQSTLGTTVNTNKVTEQTIELEFVRAENLAREQEQSAKDAMKDLELEI